jgi:uncharacterized protein YndB with AHSA1/START domain
MASESSDVVVTRTFDVPRERVWRAWSDPDEVMKWWGPQGFTSPTCRMDFREGGVTLVCMRSDQGGDLYNTWTYRSIEPPERIEFVQGFADENGGPVAPQDLGLPPGIPQEVRHVVTLTALDDGSTELTVHEYGYPNAEIATVSRAGMEQCIDKMASSLADQGDRSA